MTNKKIFISADHGLAIVYFLQSDVISTLLNAGVEVVVLTDEGLLEQIRSRFQRPGLSFETLKLKEARQYFHTVEPTWQYWLNFLRAEGASNKINTEALRCHIAQIDFEAEGKRRTLMPWMKRVIALMRRSRTVRNWVYQRQLKYSPDLYTDLFEKHQPDLVVASTPGWRFDRYLLRQAARRGVNTAAVIVGWDNPSSYSISGAPVNWINCWSEIQKQELIDGEDWDSDRIHVGGIPSYDGYFQKEWLMSREDYFNLHRLDPNRKLIGYACSFISFSPNIQNIKTLARLVSGDTLAESSQLLIRLHPNHFLNEPLFAGEREQIFKLANELPHVHVVEPVPLGGELGYYSGEDMPEKTSMMAYSDVFSTVYSTMVVEAAIHDRPIIGVCIDAPGGWNKPGRFSLPLSEIGEWPTHQRFRQAKAGKVAVNETELKNALNEYLVNPQADRENRRKFIADECTYTDGSSGKRTGEYLFSLLEKS
jgi:hypothetical protein